MSVEINQRLNAGLDDILFQFSKGNTAERLEKGIRWEGFEQVKEWKLKFGYQFHIYSNDHFIDKKPHFHLLNQSNKIDCRFFFDGTLHDCKSSGKVEKKVLDAIRYFVTKKNQQSFLVKLWNSKNPQCLI